MLSAVHTIPIVFFTIAAALAVLLIVDFILAIVGGKRVRRVDDALFMVLTVLILLIALVLGAFAVINKFAPFGISAANAGGKLAFYYGADRLFSVPYIGRATEVFDYFGLWGLIVPFAVLLIGLANIIALSVNTYGKRKAAKLLAESEIEKEAQKDEGEGAEGKEDEATEEQPAADEATEEQPAEEEAENGEVSEEEAEEQSSEEDGEVESSEDKSGESEYAEEEQSDDFDEMDTERAFGIVDEIDKLVDEESNAVIEEDSYEDTLEEELEGEPLFDPIDEELSDEQLDEELEEENIEEQFEEELYEQPEEQPIAESEEELAEEQPEEELVEEPAEEQAEEELIEQPKEELAEEQPIAESEEELYEQAEEEPIAEPEEELAEEQPEEEVEETPEEVVPKEPTYQPYIEDNIREPYAQNASASASFNKMMPQSVRVIVRRPTARNIEELRDRGGNVGRAALESDTVNPPAPKKKKPAVSAEQKKSNGQKKPANQNKTAERKKPAERKPQENNSASAVKPKEEKVVKKTDKQEAVQSSLPLTRKYVILNRRSAASMFNDYLNSKRDSEKKELTGSLNTIIIK